MQPLSRRHFVRGLALSVAAPKLLRAAPKPTLPMGFSTLGCPAWDWKTIVDRAAEWGFAAVEIRGIQGDMDLPRRPEFQPSERKQTLRRARDAGIAISDLGSSAQFHDRDKAARERNMEDARRFVDLAHSLSVRYVRVFGNELPKDEAPADSMARIAAGLRALGEYAKGSGVVPLLESHGGLVTSKALGQVLSDAGPDVALLWDAHHTVVSGGETPAVTFAALGRLVRHTHLKDSVPFQGGRRYVLTGEGDVPVQATVGVLAKGGYRGYYNFEWEKVWHPELAEPEVAFPHFAKTMRAYLEQAGVRPA